MRHPPLPFFQTLLIRVDHRSSSQDGLRGSVRTVSDMRVRPGPIPLSRMEVSVHTECEQYPPSQMGHPGHFVSTEAQGNYKAHEVILDVDAESGLEK